MKNGRCVKCGSTEVHVSRHFSNFIVVTSWKRAERYYHVCADCGYVETYIEDREALNAIAAEWPHAHNANPEGC